MDYQDDKSGNLYKKSGNPLFSFNFVKPVGR